MSYDFVEGDNSTLTETCYDQDGSAIDLTGATVRLFWVSESGKKFSAQATLSDASNGVITYQFQGYENSRVELLPGKMSLEIMITDSSGYRYTLTTPKTYQVRAHLHTETSK